jgi:hypothetical protein
MFQWLRNLLDNKDGAPIRFWQPKRWDWEEEPDTEPEPKRPAWCNWPNPCGCYGCRNEPKL